MKYVYTDKHHLHDPRTEIEASGLNEPREKPARLDEIAHALATDPTFERVELTPHGLGPIKNVHDPAMVDFLSEAWARFQVQVRDSREVVPDVFAMSSLRLGMDGGRAPLPVDAQLGWYCFETTTPLVAGTFEAATAAVDVALTATDLVLDSLSSAPVAYAACRPPGHHAAYNLYGGYCFFNNVAVAANYALNRLGSGAQSGARSGPAARVSILDVDYHHGNGTQQIFYQRHDVQFVSLHADPTRAYPFHLGFADETGAGKGAGANLNLPLPANTTDDQFMSTLEIACEAVVEFKPEILFVSVGFDISATDPLGDFAVTPEGFARIGEKIAALDLPTVIVQEGGYDVNRLGEYALCFLRPFARR
jgi:acetoin utilization deacetylase AcuC-like enzyme